MKTRIKSEALFERAKKVAPGGVHSPVRAFRSVGGVPCFIEKSDGAYLYDVDGSRYVDFCMSWGPLIFGHQDPEVADAVKSALSRGWSYGACEPYSLELAELMVSNLPWVEKVRFVSSGTEAVMSALRVARAATGRNRILKFDGCYHGHADPMLVKAGSGLAEAPSPDSAGVSQSAASETVVVPLDDSKALEQAFQLFGKEIAAVIVEPVPANNGLLLQKDGFLKNLRKLCDSNGSLLIFDEVITGFRMAFGGMAEISGVKPDLVTYGKVIGGGFPVGAYCGKKEFMSLVAPEGGVYQAGTLSANPVAVSAGLATLKKLLRDNPYLKLNALGEGFASKVEKETPIRVQRAESLFWFILDTAKTSDGVVRAPNQFPERQKERYAKLFHGLLDKGFYLAPSGFEVSFLSTAHTAGMMDELAHHLKEEWLKNFS